VNTFVPLLGFALVSSGTPGPNNVLLWASGATFGLRATLPHVLGTAAGIGAMALGAAAGLAALVTEVPTLGIVLKIAGSAYLLVLAWRIAAASGLDRAVVARPLGFLAAAGFQALNPKAWVFALGAVTTFRPTDLDPIPGGLAVALTMVAAILPTAALWAAAGGFLGRLIADERSRRVTSVAMGGLLAASVALAWI
jgi:threonine/homoserine/homoserine lactone efflux protein